MGWGKTACVYLVVCAAHSYQISSSQFANRSSDNGSSLIRKAEATWHPTQAQQFISQIPSMKHISLEFPPGTINTSRVIADLRPWLMFLRHPGVDQNPASSAWLWKKFQGPDLPCLDGAYLESSQVLLLAKVSVVGKANLVPSQVSPPC